MSDFCYACVTFGGVSECRGTRTDGVLPKEARPNEVRQWLGSKGPRTAPLAWVYFQRQPQSTCSCTRALWVPESSLAGFVWVGFWGLGGPWGL